MAYVTAGLTPGFLCGKDSQTAANLTRDDRVPVTIDHDTPDIMAAGFGHTDPVWCAAAPA